MNAILSTALAIKNAPTSGPNKNNFLQQTFVLRNPKGLHCRPDALFVKTLKPFNCQVIVKSPRTLADGRSILGLLSLAAGYGTRLTVIVIGPDAKPAMMAIQRLFDFNSAHAYEQSGLAVEISTDAIYETPA